MLGVPSRHEVIRCGLKVIDKESQVIQARCKANKRMNLNQLQHEFSPLAVGR